MAISLGIYPIFRQTHMLPRRNSWLRLGKPTLQRRRSSVVVLYHRSVQDRTVSRGPGLLPYPTAAVAETSTAHVTIGPKRGFIICHGLWEWTTVIDNNWQTSERWPFIVDFPIKNGHFRDGNGWTLMKSAENKTGLEHPPGTEQHPMVSAPQCGVVRNALWNGNEQ